MDPESGGPNQCGPESETRSINVGFVKTAAVVCIQNLIWKDEEGTQERQAKLKEIGYVII